MIKIKDTYFIFDLDGTITDTLPDIVFSVNTMLEKINMPKRSEQEVKLSIGFGIHKVVETLTEIQDKAFIENAVSFFRESYEKHFLDNTFLYEGVKEFVSHRDFRGSVISNKPQVFVKKILKGLGISACFNTCVGGLSRFPHKPDKASTIYVIERFASRRNPLFVGDSVIDQQTARNARISYCYAKYGYESHNEHLIQADFVIDHFQDLNHLFS